MADFAALPLFTDAYLADTRHLTTEEHGAYMLLLMEAWRRPNCDLPDNDHLLSRLTGLSLTRWGEIKPVIMEFWKRDGRSATFRQKRLSAERAYVAGKTRLAKDAAAKRWKGKKKDDADAMPKPCRNDAPTPTPTPTEEEERECKHSHALLPKSQRFSEFWASYPHRGNVRRGRKPAEAKYDAAVRAGAAEQSIIEGAKRAAQDRQVRAGYARDPTTWLNQAGWDDEIDTSWENGNGKRTNDPRDDPTLRLISIAAKMR